MLNLIATTDKLELVTSSVADIAVNVSGTDLDNTTLSAQVATLYRETPQTVTSIGTVDIALAPAANHQRNVKFISLKNVHATDPNTVTVRMNANAVIGKLFEVTLAAGEELVFNDGVWFKFDVYGGVYGNQLPVASDSVAGAILVASRGDLEAGTGLDRAVTPARQHYHKGHPKAWVKCGVTGNILDQYGVASLTDQGTGDLTVNWTTAFSTVDYVAQVMVEMTATTYAVANVRIPSIRQGGQAVGSCRFICIDATATTALAKDPTSWHVLAMGALV